MVLNLITYNPMDYIGTTIVLVAVLWFAGRCYIIWRRRRKMTRLSDEAFAGMFGEDDISKTALRVRKILAHTLGGVAEKIKPDDDLYHIAALGDDFDLRYTGFIMDLEKEFGLKIPDEVAGKQHTLRRLTEYLHNAVDKNAPSPSAP